MSKRELERVQIVAMGQAHADEVSSWSYPGVYSFYDSAAHTDSLSELLDPRVRPDRYFSATELEDGLIGFVAITAAEAGSVEIVLGLRPEWLGRGLGEAFVAKVCDWAVERTAARTLVLQVAAFNTRAITVYERVGFTAASVQSVQTRGTLVPFVTMRRVGAR